MEEELVSTCNEESKHRKALKRYKFLDTSIEPELKLAGAEDPDSVKVEFIRAFNWYNAHNDKVKAKSWILAYAKANVNDKFNLEAIAACNEFACTTGWLARICSRGTKLPLHYADHLKAALRKMEEKGKTELSQYRNRLNKLSIGRERAQEKFQEHVKILTDACIGELEFQIDEFVRNGFKSLLDLQAFLKEQKICKDQCASIVDWFEQHHLQELTKLVSGKDKYLQEAYGCFTKTQQQELKKFVERIISTCKTWSELAPDKVKQQRKPRKRKEKTPQQLVKKLQYLAESKEYNLKSVPPEKIVGATQIWVFNVKYRKLGVYNSADSAGLSMKGSTLKNFDLSTSVEKKLRKPKEILLGILEGSKPAIRKSLQTIKCKEQKLTGRINKDTIILRVF